MTSKVERLMTIVDLEALPDDDNRYELIEGELFVYPAPGIPHQLVLNRLQFDLNRDLVAKRALYAKNGVEEYWRVDGDKRQVMTLHLHGADLVETATLTASDLLTSQVISNFSVTVESLFNDVR